MAIHCPMILKNIFNVVGVLLALEGKWEIRYDSSLLKEEIS